MNQNVISFLASYQNDRIMDLEGGEGIIWSSPILYLFFFFVKETNLSGNDSHLMLAKNRTKGNWKIADLNQRGEVTAHDHPEVSDGASI